jgi:hypothetical protein
MTEVGKVWVFDLDLMDWKYRLGDYLSGCIYEKDRSDNLGLDMRNY